MRTLDEIFAEIEDLQQQAANNQQRKKLIIYYALKCKNCKKNWQISAGINCHTVPFPECFDPDDKWLKKWREKHGGMTARGNLKNMPPAERQAGGWHEREA